LLVAIISFADSITVCVWGGSGSCSGGLNTCYSVNPGGCRTNDGAPTSTRFSSVGNTVTADEYASSNCNGTILNTQSYTCGKCQASIGNEASTLATCGAGSLPISLGALIFVSGYLVRALQPRYSIRKRASDQLRSL